MKITNLLTTDEERKVNIKTVLIFLSIILLVIFTFFTDNFKFNSIDDNNIKFLILLPTMSVIILIWRQVIGLKTFGLFGPLIVAFSFITMGIVTGLSIYILLLTVGIFTDLILRKFLLQITSRRSLQLFLLTIVGLLMYSYYKNFETFGLPFLITAFLIDNFNQTCEREGFKIGLELLFETIFISILISVFTGFIISSFDFYQSIKIMLISLIFAIMISLYNGMRLTEIIRFRKLL